MRKKTGFYLSMALLAVCGSPSHAGDIESVVLTKSATSWNGQPLPSYSEGQPEVTILRITIPPHQRLPMHSHPLINAGVLLKGELTVITESGQTTQLKPNDSIVEVVNTWHYGVNEGDSPAELIVFYAGVKGQPLSIVKQGQ